MVHFQKRRKYNSNLVIFWKKSVMFPDYIYKSFDTFTKIIIAIIENYIKPVGELMYEGQGHKLSDFKMKKKGILH